MAVNKGRATGADPFDSELRQRTGATKQSNGNLRQDHEEDDKKMAIKVSQFDGGCTHSKPILFFPPDLLETDERRNSPNQPSNPPSPSSMNTNSSSRL